MDAGGGKVAYLETAHSTPKDINNVGEFLNLIQEWDQRSRPDNSGFLSELWYRGVNEKFPDERPGVYRGDFTRRADQLWSGGNIENVKLARTGEGSTGTPASRAMIERFLREKNAQLWIGHSTTFFRNAIKSPGWYD
jgi:hypothetical protein